MSGGADIDPDRDAEAAEYALGLLEPEARAAFETRLAADPALRAEVTAWEAHFAAMAETEVTPVPPPVRAKARIDAALFGATGQGAQPGGLWHRIAFWRGLGLAGIAASAVLALLLLVPTAPTQPDRFAVQLLPADSEQSFLALVGPDLTTLTINRVDGIAAEGRAQEVWAILGDNAPVSLGLLGPDGRADLVLPEALRPLIADLVIAVSDEPPGGSPTGAPTGAVLAAGGVVSL
ncbi:anti-sigma factor domain-containing protein [Hasllibacter sp. MH4015]|uniref:anti-sigma factor n=1 Tax=Hasllibacter sp. MH4015 TaxID=2854029 RepID=UPI001CD33ABA|nr:anti-sigma factor [Hasllibacter sp. MH4015]